MALELCTFQKDVLFAEILMSSSPKDSVPYQEHESIVTPCPDRSTPPPDKPFRAARGRGAEDGRAQHSSPAETPLLAAAFAVPAVRLMVTLGEEV